MYTEDQHFKHFATNLEKVIEKYENLSEETLLERQKRQIETLVALEKEFRKTLINHRSGPVVYKKFIELICDEKRNILAARPFFRERQEIFTQQISKALKKRAEKSLYRFHFNYQFILFVMRTRKWGPTSKITVLYNKIASLRTEIVEMNMPLAISRARIFWSRTPKSQLSYMDLVQISCEGLMSAVDKFCLPYSKVFRAVIIGRIVGNFIEQYSETLIHFYPKDKRKIYRANKNIHKFSGIVDFDKLTELVNEGVEGDHKTNSAEIADLMAAASCVSTDSTPSNSVGEISDPVERFAAPANARPDVSVETENAMNALADAYSCLSLLEVKLLKMKGLPL